MTTSRLAFLSSLPFVLLGAQAASALDYQCERGTVDRSIAVEYEEAGQRVPCEVIYHKPPQDPRVLWRADSEVGFCESKAEELVGTLESSGWACERTEAAAAATPRDPAGTQDATEPGAGMAGAERREGEMPAAPQGALPEVSDAALESALARDLRKLKSSSDADVQADGASYGDLNGDGRDDAAVLITFDSGGADYVQYLVAYLYGKDGYQPTASHLVGGRHREIHGGKLEGIASGAIVLDLQILKPEDEACCPSGSRTAVFVLENGDLVPIGEAPARAG